MKEKAVKRTSIDGEDIPVEEEDMPDYDDEDESPVYQGKSYIIDGEDEDEEYGKSPSMIDAAIEEEKNTPAVEKQKLESDIIKKLQRDRDPIGSVNYSSNGPVSPEEERSAVKALLLVDDSIEGMKKIADKFHIDMKRVLAIKAEEDEEKRRREHEQALLMQQRMMEIRNPEIPRQQSRRQNDYEDEEEEYEERSERGERRRSLPVAPPPMAPTTDMTGALLTFMLNQATTADKRSFDMLQVMMQNQQSQMNMFMEMNNKKGSGGGFFDGEFGDMMKARMMANILSPGSGQEVSGTALILKGLVDSGQLGAILTEATGLLRDLASKGRDDGFEPMDVDSRDISTLPPQYRDEPKRIPPKKTPTPPTDEEYEEIPPQQKKKFAEKPQKQRPVSLPPEGVEFDNFTPEWWAKKIVERFDGTEWDVALKAAELVVKKAELSGTDMTNPNEQKEMAYGMLAIIGGAQGVVALARASKQYMEFDSNGDFKRQPEEAAEFVKEHMPDKIGVLKALDFNMMIETATHFENCKSMAKAIFFLKHPKVSPAVKRFLSTIKNSPMSRRPPSVDDGPVDDDEENPFGGF